MNKSQKSNQNGALNRATTGTRPAMPSSNAASILLPKSRLTSDMSDSTVQIKETVDFQITPNSQALAPNVQKAKLLNALAVALGALVSWHKVELGGGRVGWALFFDEHRWVVDPLTHELTPLGEK